jgi:hypothetical protein
MYGTGVILARRVVNAKEVRGVRFLYTVRLGLSLLPPSLPHHSLDLQRTATTGGGARQPPHRPAEGRTAG